jgi:hypothetical protein
MSQFRQAVHEMVTDGLRSLSHPVQGYIPSPNGIDKNTNTCTVRIPNPHGGVHPTNDGNYIELKAVPLPFFFKGFLGGILDLVSKGDRGVIVGFKGSNMANPYIVSPLPALLHADKFDQTVDDRSSVNTARTSNVGGSHQLVTPDTVMQPLPQVKTFGEISSGAPQPPRQFVTADIQKLSPFTNLQINMQSSVSSATSRVTTPSIVPKK